MFFSSANEKSGGCAGDRGEKPDGSSVRPAHGAAHERARNGRRREHDVQMNWLVIAVERSAEGRR